MSYTNGKGYTRLAMALIAFAIVYITILIGIVASNFSHRQQIPPQQDQVYLRKNTQGSQN